MAGAIAPTVAVAVAVFGLALNNGTYEVVDRGALAVVVWWAVGLFVALGMWPRERSPLAALVAGGGLLALAGITALSIGWADSAEKAYAEVARVLLYVGVLALVVLATRRGDAPRWCDGLAIGISAVGVLALVSDLYPDFVGPDAPPSFFPSEDRLSWPVNYWNGLGILVGLAFPLLLRAAVAGRRALWRALALAPAPALTATIYLTSSRGGAATAAVGVLVFLAFTRRRLTAFAAFAVLGVSSAAAVAVLVDRRALADAPLGSAQAAAQADSAAFLIATLAACAAVAFWAWCTFIEPRIRPAAARRAGIVLLAAFAVGLVAATAAADPVQKFDDFKRPPREQRIPEGDFTKGHLLSANGSGRWQVWASAVDQFQEKPVLGTGAGSFEAWWAEHGTLRKFLRDAHSLYLETMGELGIIGLLALVTALGAGFVAAFRRGLRASRRDRTTIAALAATLAAFGVAAAIDWMWELASVAVIAIVCLGLLVGPATAPAPPEALAGPPADPPDPAGGPDGSAGSPDGRRRLATLARAAVVATAVLAICLEGVLVLSQARLQDSRVAADRGDRSSAVSAALDARTIQPWASSPYLQLALLDEEAGKLRAARELIAKAIDRDPSDWRLWLVSARLEAKAGNIRSARRSLDRARMLNPRSPLFAKNTDASG